MEPRALLDDWLASGTLRPSTQARYRPQVDDWLTWCEQEGVHPYFARIEHVAKWSEKRLIPHLDGRAFDGPAALAYITDTAPEVAGTHDGFITAVTQYYKAAHDRGLITGVPNLTDLRSGLDRDRDQPQRLTYMERAAFFACIGMWGADKARHYLRDRLIAYLLLEGLRPGEIVRMDMRHLYELPDGTIEVRAPDDFENVGQKFTLEPLTVGALKAYLPYRPKPADGVHELILGQGGRPVVSRYPNMLIRQMAATEPTLAQRRPPVTADVVAHTGFWDTPAPDQDS
jgi:integrase